MTSTNETLGTANSVILPRKAASVLLLRTRDKSLEVFIQYRTTTMDFAAGMVVFPGGRVDPVDHLEAMKDPPATLIMESHAAAWCNTSLSESGHENTSFESAVVLAAARREVFEETGCLLAPSQLNPWANWVTPPQQPKRFDTFFYVAAPSPENLPAHQTTEADSSVWMAVDEVLSAHVRGGLSLMRPTQVLLQSVLDMGSLESILDARFPIIPVRP